MKLTSDQLCIDTRGYEWYDREDQNRDVCAALSSGCKFGSRSQRCQLSNTGSCASDRHAANESVHCLCGGSDDCSNDKQTRTQQRDVSTTHEVRHATDKRADSCEGQKAAENKPNPSINTTDVSINVWRNGSPEVERYLTTSP